jgi:hypothetical protein
MEGTAMHVRVNVCGRIFSSSSSNPKKGIGYLFFESISKNLLSSG